MVISLAAAAACAAPAPAEAQDGPAKRPNHINLAAVPAALQFKCYFVAFDPGGTRNLTAASIHTFNSPRYRACIEDNLRRLGLVSR